MTNMGTGRVSLLNIIFIGTHEVIVPNLKIVSPLYTKQDDLFNF